MVRRVAAIVLMLGGLALVVIPLAAHAYTAAPPTQRVLDTFRPVMTKPAIDTIRADLNQLDSASQQLNTTVIPALAAQLKLTPDQLSAALATRYPAVANGVTALPGIVTTFKGVGNLLDTQRSNFKAADTVPAPGLPITLVPWTMLLAGLASIGAGTLLLVRRGVRPAAVTLGAGAVIVALVLALNLPHKAVAADHLVNAFRPVITTTVVTQARHDLGTVAALTTELETKLIPDVATQLNTTPAQLQAGLALQAPAVATALARMPIYSATFIALVNKVDSRVADFRQTKRVRSLTFLDWLLLAVGGLGIAAGGLALLIPGRSQSATVTTRTKSRADSPSGSLVG
jgi:hypothetical protein